MARTRKEIIAEMLQALRQEYDKREGSVFYDLQMPTAIQIERREQKDECILNNAFYDTADDTHKQIIAKDRANIERKEAKASSGEIQVTGDSGAMIRVGDKVASDALTFTVVQEAVVQANGTATVPVVCDTKGAAGNVPVGAIKEFPVTIQGLATATNREKFTGGFDKESMESLGRRYKEKVQLPATSGNVNHYRIWAGEVQGVGEIRIQPRTPARGSVTILIIDANKRRASEELIAATQVHIDSNRPYPANAIVKSVAEVPIAIKVTIAAAEEKDVTAAIRQAATDYFKEIAFREAYVSYAKIGRMILNVPGVDDFNGLTINEGVENIQIGEEEVAVLGGVTIERAV